RHVLFRRDDAEIERHARDGQLPRRRGRLTGGDHTIEQRDARVLVQDLEVGGRDAADEQIRVVARIAVRGQHAAVLRVDGYDRALPFLREDSGDVLLQVQVQVEMQVTPGNGRKTGLLGQPPLDTTACVNLQIALAGRAAQQLLVLSLQPRLPDEATLLVPLELRQLELRL